MVTDVEIEAGANAIYGEAGEQDGGGENSVSHRLAKVVLLAAARARPAPAADGEVEATINELEEFRIPGVEDYPDDEPEICAKAATLIRRLVAERDEARYHNGNLTSDMNKLEEERDTAETEAATLAKHHLKCQDDLNIAISERNALAAQLARPAPAQGSEQEVARLLTAIIELKPEDMPHAIENSMAAAIAREALAALPRPQEGWQLVPTQATEEMWQAGREADIHHGDSYSKVYSAMLRAAPTPATQTDRSC